MTRCRLTLDGHGSWDTTAVDELEPESALQLQSGERSTIDVEQDSALLHNADEIGRSETISVVPVRKILMIEVFISTVNRYVKKVFDMPHCNIFFIEEIRGNLRSVISWCDLVREGVSRLFET